MTEHIQIITRSTGQTRTLSIHRSYLLIFSLGCLTTRLFIFIQLVFPYPMSYRAYFHLKYFSTVPLTTRQKREPHKYSMGACQLTDVLSVDYLTVLSVQQLKALYVLQLDALWQRLPLEVDVWELWESSGCVCNTRTLDTQREITLNAQGESG